MDQHKLAIVGAYLLLQKKRRKRKLWHKQWLGDFQRLQHSFVFNLEPLIFSSTAVNCQSYLRLCPKKYNELLSEISPLILKQHTNKRLAITPRERLSITLSFLAEGKLFIISHFKLVYHGTFIFERSFSPTTFIRIQGWSINSKWNNSWNSPGYATNLVPKIFNNAEVRGGVGGYCWSIPITVAIS